MNWNIYGYTCKAFGDVLSLVEYTAKCNTFTIVFFQLMNIFLIKTSFCLSVQISWKPCGCLLVEVELFNQCVNHPLMNAEIWSLVFFNLILELYLVIYCLGYFRYKHFVLYSNFPVLQLIVLFYCDKYQLNNQPLTNSLLIVPCPVNCARITTC